MGWLIGWVYRKSHVINSAAGTGTNYQVQITAHYGDGTDSDDDVYCNGHCKTDFGDIRFTSSDGSTLLDYWMQEKTDGDRAVFWVEIAEDLSSENRTIYINYGNDSATTLSNGEDTFIFFDDFLGTALDATKWDIHNGNANISVSDSWITVSTTNNDLKGIISKSTFGPSNKRFMCLGQIATASGRQGMLGLSNYDPSWGPTKTLAFYFQHWLLTTYAVLSGNGVGIWLDRALYPLFIYDEGEAIHIFEMCWGIGKVYYYVWKNTTTGTPSAIEDQLTYIPTDAINIVALPITKIGYTTDSTIRMDWVAIAKFVDPEPTHGAWGWEEDTLETCIIVYQEQRVGFSPIEWRESQECNPAIRNIPFADSQYLDAGTWVLKPRELNITVRMSDAEKKNFDSLFESVPPSITNIYVQIYLYSNQDDPSSDYWYYEGWIENKNYKWNYVMQKNRKVRWWETRLVVRVKNFNYVGV